MKRTLICLTVVFLLVGSFGLLGCKTSVFEEPDVPAEATATESIPEPTAEPTPEPLFYGADVSQAGIDLQCNIQNFSCFAYDSGWIYGQTWAGAGYSLFSRMRADGSKSEKLDIGMACNVIVNDGYVYYTMMRETTQGIYRIRLSDLQMEHIQDAFGEFQIVGDQLYYSDHTYEYSDEFAQSDAMTVPADKSHLFRCNLDGSDPVEIIAKPTFYFYVLGNAILYQDDNDGSALHVCGLDGSNDQKIADGYAYCPIYDGEFIYYTRADLNDASNNGIWRVRPDGTDGAIVARKNSDGGILLRGDSIYYSNADDNDRIYRINKDGSGDTPISQDAYTGRMQFLAEGLKYTVYTSDYSGIVGNYLCALDGSNPKEMN